MTIEAIKEAIEELPPRAKTRLAAWILRRDREEWDHQVQEDFSPGGRGTALLQEAEADIRKGRARPLDELLAETRTKRNPRPKRQR
jgi:hypothetical protein